MIFLNLIIGFSSGAMVGAGVLSLLVLVGIIPRLSQVSKTTNFITLYERILIFGAIFGSLISIQGFKINLGFLSILISGLFYGVFVGFLSSGLAEVLDYIPIISRRLKIPTLYLKYLIIALIIGKVIGSFVGWKIINGG